MKIAASRLLFFCDPAGAQTQNLQNRNLTLYSIELQGQNLFFFSAPSAGSTLAVDKKRETLHFEIGIFSFFHQPLDGFILDIRHTAAIQAYDLHAGAREDYQFVLISRFTALPVIHMQYLGVYQQLQHIIHRSHRDTFRFARLHQLLSRKGLR